MVILRSRQLDEGQTIADARPYVLQPGEFGYLGDESVRLLLVGDGVRDVGELLDAGEVLPVDGLGVPVGAIAGDATALSLSTGDPLVERARLTAAGLRLEPGGVTAAAAASALLELVSTTQGVLFPRMTTAEVGAIASPAAALVAFDTDKGSAVHHDSVAWRTGLEAFAASAPAAGAWSVGDRVWNDSPTAGGTVGWVCTAAGSPGTWKAFGSIAP